MIKYMYNIVLHAIVYQTAQCQLKIEIVQQIRIVPSNIQCYYSKFEKYLYSYK